MNRYRFVVNWRVRILISVGKSDRENRAIFVGGRGGGNARRRIDSSVEKDVARTLTNRKGDVSCVVEREEDLCYEPR